MFELMVNSMWVDLFSHGSINLFSVGVQWINQKEHIDPINGNYISYASPSILNFVAFPIHFDIGSDTG